jgi:hypothetical protein
MALALLGVVESALPAVARDVPVRRRSPRATIALDLPHAQVTIDYGRPALAGRLGFGGIAPWSQVWRLGDDESTRLQTDVPLRLGGVAIEPGAYALFLLPVEAGRFLLVINRAAERWGAFNYDPALDVGRVELRVGRLERQLERLSLAWEPTIDRGGRRGRLWLGWETWVLSTDFEAGESALPVEKSAEATVNAPAPS